MATVDDSAKGVGIASDVTGIASQMLSFVNNLPSADRLFNKATPRNLPFGNSKR